jgi:hypothetical protein
VFGQLPAVAALDLAQQAGDKPPDPPAGFGTLEVPPDPSMSLWSAAAQPPITSLVACPTTMMPPKQHSLPETIISLEAKCGCRAGVLWICPIGEVVLPTDPTRSARRRRRRLAA